MTFQEYPNNRCLREVFSLQNHDWGIAMKPTFVPHEDYQKFVMNQCQNHYYGGIQTLVNADCPVITKLWITDLSEISTMLVDVYG